MILDAYCWETSFVHTTHFLTVWPSQGEVLDAGGWEAYSGDWRYFFDCMLAPSARQAASALDKLVINPLPLAGSANRGRTGGIPDTVAKWVPQGDEPRRQWA